MSTLISNLSGFKYFFKGLACMFHSGLKRFTVIPVIINIVVFSIAMWFGFSWVSDLSQNIVNEYLPSWLSWVSYIFNFLIFSILLVLVFYFFCTIALIIGAPFYSILAEKVQKIFYNDAPFSSTMSISETIQDVPHIILLEIKKLYYRIPIMLTSLILIFVPLIGQLSAIILTSWCYSLDYTSYSYENNRYKLKTTRQNIKENWLLCLSFGCAVWAALLIPFLNLIMIPAAVVGATMLWNEKLRISLPEPDDLPKKLED